LPLGVEEEVDLAPVHASLVGGRDIQRSGFEVAMLQEPCVQEVLRLPPEQVASDIRLLLRDGTLPEDEARSLSTWACAELARTLIQTDRPPRRRGRQDQRSLVLGWRLRRLGG